MRDVSPRPSAEGLSTCWGFEMPILTVARDRVRIYSGWARRDAGLLRLQQEEDLRPQEIMYAARQILLILHARRQTGPKIQALAGRTANYLIKKGDSILLFQSSRPI